MRPLRRGATGAKQREVPGPQERLRGAWYADPFAKAAERWWGGAKWTQEVRGAPTSSTASPVPAKGSVRRARNAVRSTGAEQAVAGKSRVCRRCHGTGAVTYDTGSRANVQAAWARAELRLRTAWPISSSQPSASQYSSC
jgi:hypothetical protein